ncbi:RNA-binding domain-containing protein [Wilcoxina mikolae CBS 423.85]|nr:RNA-binding domain-containing protein [Wilcoxina mikolae CBS 423.85]
MSYPPPPGTNNSLPPRPPPPLNAFTRFAPRQVASSTPHLSAPPQHSYAASPAVDYSNAYQAPVYQGYTAPVSTPSYSAAPTISAAPHIVNPFPLPGTVGSGVGGRKGADPRYADLDPELQAQIAQQQSIYDPSNAENLKARSQPRPVTVEAGPSSGGKNGAAAAAAAKVPTVVRQGGGQTWTDSTLLEWDPSHFRLFVGNLAGEVTDDSLLKAFSKYPSVKKARVVRDKRTTKSKGYGFVAFADGDEYFRAAREMQGKYIGSHPVLLKRSNTEIKPVVVGGNKTKGGRIDKNKKKKGKGKHGETKNVLG